MRKILTILFATLTAKTNAPIVQPIFWINQQKTGQMENKKYVNFQNFLAIIEEQNSEKYFDIWAENSNSNSWESYNFGTLSNSATSTTSEFEELPLEADPNQSKNFGTFGHNMQVGRFFKNNQKDVENLKIVLETAWNLKNSQPSNSSDFRINFDEAIRFLTKILVFFAQIKTTAKIHQTIFEALNESESFLTNSTFSTELLEKFVQIRNYIYLVENQFRLEKRIYKLRQEFVKNAIINLRKI